MDAESRQRRLRDLFDRAIELPAAERDAFVHARAPDDPGLARELLDLLSRANGGAAPNHGRTAGPHADVFRKTPLGDGFNLLDALNRDSTARRHADSRPDPLPPPAADR